MKRDMDLVRQIVLAARDAELGKPLVSLPDVEPIDFAAHVQLLAEAGLVYAALQPDNMRPARSAAVWRLTWAGQDFADSIAEDTIWNRARDAVIKPTAGAAFDLLLAWLKAEGLKRLGLG